MRVLGWGLLLVSLLGWSAWWVICNVYEFAPALASGALLLAWCMALLAVLTAGRQAWPAWVLAGVNALYLLAVHRQLDRGSGTAVFGLLAMLMAGLYVASRCKQKRPA